MCHQREENLQIGWLHWKGENKKYQIDISSLIFIVLFLFQDVKISHVMPKKSHFTVEVQSAVKSIFQVFDEDGPLLVRNKDKTVMGELHKDDNPVAHGNLVRMIKENGWKGLRGHFFAIFDPKDNMKIKNADEKHNFKLKINTQKIQPIETW